MNAALHRRLKKLETIVELTTIRVCREMSFPDLEVRFVSADPNSYPQADSYPQGNDYHPVDKSGKPDMVIELEAGEDLNAVARQLEISADELHRQIQRGQVCMVYPPTPASLAPQPIQICWELP